jgi:hypothetical protein
VICCDVDAICENADDGANWRRLDEPIYEGCEENEHLGPGQHQGKIEQPTSMNIKDLFIESYFKHTPSSGNSRQKQPQFQSSTKSVQTELLLQDKQA